MIGGVSGVSGGPAGKDAFAAVAGRSCRGPGALLAAWVPEHFKRGSCGQDTRPRLAVDRDLGNSIAN